LYLKIAQKTKKKLILLFEKYKQYKVEKYSKNQEKQKRY